MHVLAPPDGTSSGVELDDEMLRKRAQQPQLSVRTMGGTQVALQQQGFKGLCDLCCGDKRTDAPLQPIAKQHVMARRPVGIEVARVIDPALIKHRRLGADHQIVAATNTSSVPGTRSYCVIRCASPK